MNEGPIPGITYTWWTWKFGMTFTNWVLRFFGRVECDRCHKWVKGFLSGGEGVSGGVYEGWRQYTPDTTEWIICDQCMWQNELYLKNYPSQRGAKA